MPGAVEWTERDDVALCHGWLRASAASPTALGSPAFWLEIAAPLPFPLASCRARWETVLFPQLCSFDACFDAARDALPTHSEPRAFERASGLFVSLTSGMAFRARRCWALWRDRGFAAQRAPGVYLHGPQGTTLEHCKWTRALDEALCRAWVQRTSCADAAQVEMTPRFWRELTKSSGGLRTMPWQASFYRWREIKRVLRATHESIGSKRKSGSLSQDVGSSSEQVRLAHCWAILKSGPELQVEASSGSCAIVESAAPEPVKRPRGRPRKYPRVEPPVPQVVASVVNTNSVAQHSTIEFPESRGPRRDGASTNGAVVAAMDIAEAQRVITTRDQSVGTEARSHRTVAVNATATTASKATNTSQLTVRAYRDQATYTHDLHIMEEEKHEEMVQEAIFQQQQRALDAASSKNELLEMQLGMQLFSQTLPTDPQGHEYFTLLRKTLLRRARKRWSEETYEERSVGSDSLEA